MNALYDEIDRLQEENERLKADAEGYRNGQLQAQALADGLYESCQKHGEWRKRAEARIARLDGLLAECHAVLDDAGWMFNFENILEKLRAELGIDPFAADSWEEPCTEKK